MFDFHGHPIGLNYKNILLKHGKCIVNSRSECDISTEIAGKKVNCCLIPSNMKSILTKDICKIFDDAGWFHIYHRIDGTEDIFNYVRQANEEKWNFVSISIGVKEGDYKLLKKIDDNGYKLTSITIDVALSWQNKVEEMIKYVKKNFPYVYLIVGNGSRPEWIEWLERLNVDCAKLHIGVSAACLTKQLTGFGSTTITDLIKCSGAANNIKIMADGGLTVSENGVIELGGIAKAIRFGADFVCSGSVFSKCIDSPSLLNGYSGNASERSKGHKNHVEGTTVNVKTSGLTIKETIKLVEDSIKSSVSYASGTKISDLKYVDYQIVL